MNPEIFGWQHLLILFLSIALMVSSIIIMCKYVKEEKTKTLIIKIVAGVLLASVLLNRISIVFKYETPEWYRLIPDSFCGMSSFVLSLSVLVGKKNNNVLHFVWFMELVGGVSTMLYPDFIGQASSVFYLPTISGLLHHILGVYLVLLILVFGYITITYKKWYCTLFGFTCYLTVGAFEISVFRLADAFYINKPILSGTPLNVWVLVPIYIVLYGAVLGVVEYVRHKKNMSQNKNTLNEK